MQDFKDYVSENSKKRLLTIFCHPDDESFVAGGLFQEAAFLGLETHLVCLTGGESGKNSYKGGDLKKIRSGEFEKACKLLGIENYFLWNFPDAHLQTSVAAWLPEVEKLINKLSPDIVVTFDFSGITGHPDHIASCREILDLVKKQKRKIDLLWRVPDEYEVKFFKDNDALKFASKANLKVSCGLTQSYKKIKSIYAHKSQMPNFAFKLHILEWCLFDHKELYYKVDLTKKYD